MVATRKEITQLLRNLNGLNFLRRNDPEGARALLTLYNYAHVTGDPESKRVRFYQDLASLMMAEKIFDEIIEGAKELINDPGKLNEFLIIVGTEAIELPPPPPSPISDYMSTIPRKFITTQKATFSDYQEFFKIANDENRYFIVVDDTSGTMLGLLSINDYPEGENSSGVGKDTLLLDVPTFNRKPFVVNQNKSMEYANELYEQGKKEKKITKLLIVDDINKPVGTIGRSDIIRWRTNLSEKVVFS